MAPVDMEQALLAAITADPCDHAARLALADWLEEAGRIEQAELARLHARQLAGTGTREELERLSSLRGVRPVVPEVVNSVGMRLALIPPGSFRMGAWEDVEAEECEECAECELPYHPVRITRPYYLGVFPVTQSEYEAVIGETPSHFRKGAGGEEHVAGMDTANFPVESVTWFEAAAFCHRISARPDERRARRIYRLPTEAEWEYACRGGAAHHQCFHFGQGLSAFQANIDGTLPTVGSPYGPNLRRTCEVGRYPPNAFGLHDLHGNVYEWCGDWFAEDYYSRSPADDPPGPPAGSRRARRGGCWCFHADCARSYSRHAESPEARDSAIGFRVAMTVTPKRTLRRRA